MGVFDRDCAHMCARLVDYDKLGYYAATSTSSAHEGEGI